MEASYGDLREDANLVRLASDVLSLIRLHIHPWDIQIGVSDILSRVRHRSLFGVFQAVYEFALSCSGKNRWGCKSTFMIDHCGTILAHLPDARLIWLVRDPRDVAASSRQSVFNPYHPYFTARLWARQQRAAMRIQETWPQNILLLRYEDLLSRPVAKLKELCDFLQEPFDREMLNFFQTPEAEKSSSLSRCWKNTARPILKDNFGKFRTQLSPKEIQLVEEEAGAEMEQLGYSLDSRPPLEGSVEGWRWGRYWMLDRAWQVKVNLNATLRDGNAGRMWARRVLVGYLNIKRLRLRARRGQNLPEKQ